ncbi:MAG TPA: hypothetical protein VF461_05895 [Gemmatimonadaceae bacterium]
MTLAAPLAVEERDGSSDATAVPARRTAWWPLALVAVAGLGLATGLAIVDALPVGVVADDAFYVILARALATGQGYHVLNVPGHPAGTHFPPGYPALLALLSFVAPAFPASVAVFKAFNALFLAASAVLVARLLRKRLEMGAGWCIAVGAVTAVSMPLLILSNLVLSELFFIAFVLALLVPLERLVDEPAPAWRVILLGVAIGVCALVRTHGIVLVPAAAFVLVARRRWREAALLTGAAVVTLLPWQLWTARHGGQLPAPLLGMYDSYAAWWLRGVREMGPSMIGQTIRKTTAETSLMLSILFSPVRTDAGRAATLAALAALTVAGVIAMRRRVPVTLLFLAGYLFIVLIWPFQTARFVWAVWPVLLAVIAAGAWEAISRRGWRLALRVALGAALLWVVVGYGAYEQRGFRGAWWSSLGRANAPRMATTTQWVATHTAPDEILATEYEGAVWLYTGRRALPIIALTPAQYLRDYSAKENVQEGLEPLLDAYPVRTVVVGTGNAFDAATFLSAERPNRLQLRERFAGGAAFTVTPR